MRLVKDLKQGSLHVHSIGGKVNIYTISSFSFGNALVDVLDKKSRLSGFFIWNDGDGKFLSYLEPTCKLQRNLSKDDLENIDYFPANIGIPIFSHKAKSLFECKGITELSLYKCLLDGESESIYLCKINNYLPIIDNEKTIFRKLTDGTKLIDIPTYKCDAEFYIARDAVFCERMVVSQKFVDLCNEGGLNIHFMKC